MCAAAEVLIDSLKFSRERQTASGALPIAGFKRLYDSLWSNDSCAGDVNYRVNGDADVRGRPILRLIVTGSLPLQCQRCLGGFVHELAIDSTLRLVQEALLDAEQSDDPDEPDCIAVSTELDLTALIEDEILLALPAYPRHEDESCVEVVGSTGSKSAKTSAFSALGAVKRKEFKSKE